MFAADSELDIGSGLAAAFRGDSNQFADPLAVERDERDRS